WWPGGRYAYVSAHFDGFTDHILCIVDLQNTTNPKILWQGWLPGMNAAGGDGGLTVHDLSDPAKPKLLSHINWSPPFPGGTHTALPLPNRNLVVVADEAN